MTRCCITTLLLCLALGTGVQQAAAQNAVLQVGDAAPAFEAVADNGEVWRSDEVVGKKILVVYFYPAAMTGGCTKQACSFRDDRSKLTGMGAEVVGVSGDRLANLEVFRKAHRLNFPLLSDTSGAVARKFGVPLREGGAITQTVDGEEVTLTRDLTSARWTFIIGLDGKIAFKNTEVDAAADSKTVLAAIEDLRETR